MRTIFNKLTRYEESIWWTIAFSVIIGLILITNSAGTGKDWRLLYRAASLSDFISFPGVANPLYIQFLFKPLAFLPIPFSNFILLSITILSIRTVSYLSRVDKWLILISFPCWWILWQTQIDGLVMLGVALGWWAIKERKPIWQGLATLLLLLKPQIGGILAVFYLIQQKHWKSYIISILVVLLSIATFGEWILPWIGRIFVEISTATNTGGNFAQTRLNIGLFPLGLLFWIPLLLFRDYYTIKEYIPAIISATMLSSPYAASYSLLATMAIPLPPWVYPILSLPLIIGRTGINLIIIAPIALIMYPIIKRMNSKLLFFSP